MRGFLPVITVLLMVACATTPTPAVRVQMEQPVPLSTSSVPELEYPVLRASLAEILPGLQSTGLECLVAPETEPSFPAVSQPESIGVLKQRFEAVCQRVSCPASLDSLITSSVAQNQERYRVADSIPLPPGYRLIPWSPTWRQSLPTSTAGGAPDSRVVVAFSRVAISDDGSLALHYLEVRQAGFAWGEYVLLAQADHEWRVFSHEWLWSGG